MASKGVCFQWSKAGKQHIERPAGPAGQAAHRDTNGRVLRSSWHHDGQAGAVRGGDLRPYSPKIDDVVARHGTEIQALKNNGRADFGLCRGDSVNSRLSEGNTLESGKAKCGTSHEPAACEK